MTIENPRGWDKPLSEYRALDIVLDRTQVAEAVKAWAIANDKIVEDGLDMPEGAYVTMTVSGERLRITYTWRETEHATALADALEGVLQAETTADIVRAKATAREAYEEWKKTR